MIKPTPGYVADFSQAQQLRQSFERLFTHGQYEAALSSILNYNDWQGYVSALDWTDLLESIVYRWGIQYGQLVGLCERLLRIPDTPLAATDLSLLRFIEGITLMAAGLFKDAFTCHTLALDIAKSEGSKPLAANAYLGLAYVHQGKGRYPEALVCYKSVFELATQLSDTEGQMARLMDIGILYAYLIKDPSQGLIYFNEGLTRASRQLDLAAEREFLSKIAWVEQGQGLASSAIRRYRRAIEIDSQLGNLAHKADDLGYLAETYAKMAQGGEISLLLQAADYGERAVAVAIKAGEIPSAQSWLVDLHRVYSKLEDGAKIAECELLIKSLGERHSTFWQAWMRWNNMGLAAEGLGRAQEALAYYLRASTEISGTDQVAVEMVAQNIMRLEQGVEVELRRTMYAEAEDVVPKLEYTTLDI